MSDEDREALRNTLAFLRQVTQTLTRRHEYANARKVRRAQVALMRDWRPGMDINSRLASIRELLGGGQ